MYVEEVPNRNSRPAILLRESYREGTKVKKRTIANLSHWPKLKIESLRRVLKGDRLVAPDDVLEIERSLPHGHVAAVYGTLKGVGLEKLIASSRCAERDLVVAMIVARVIEPGSKLATARGLNGETASTTLGEVLDVGEREVDDLYEAMDWLLARQQRIEDGLAKRHLQNGTLALYDVTSSYFEGAKCPLARMGHSRDGKKNKLQITIGLLCASDGCPVAIEVFEGSRGDPKTLGSQIRKLRERFGLERVVLVGDRGMITEARLREEIRPIEGLDWITALRSPAIRKLIDDGTIVRSLFDEKDLAEITNHPNYPEERLIVCRNPLLAEERARKRADLLEATERELDRVLRAVEREKRPLRGKDKIGQRIGGILNKYKVGKHFKLEIGEDTFRWQRDSKRVEAETRLDGFYVVRTSVRDTCLSTEQTVAAYKRLSTVERAFRSLKTIDLKIRPIYHWLEERVRAHVFLCMLAYYVEWNMRTALAPILFDDDDKPSAEKARSSIVAPAQRSARARAKDSEKRTIDGLPVHSFRTLLADLATITKNRVRYCIEDGPTFDRYSTPTRSQQTALDLLQVSIAV
jgi:hypothetical protein